MAVLRRERQRRLFTLYCKMRCAIMVSVSTWTFANEEYNFRSRLHKLVVWLKSDLVHGVGNLRSFLGVFSILSSIYCIFDYYNTIAQYFSFPYRLCASVYFLHSSGGTHAIDFWCLSGMFTSPKWISDLKSVNYWN